ncbi:MAG: cell division protein SepF [Ferrimicrobium sp.]
MAGFRRALVWLGITDDEEELESPVSRSGSWTTTTDLAEEPQPEMESRYQSSPPRVQVIANGGAVRNLDQDPSQEAKPQERKTAVLRPFTPTQERPKIHLVLPTKYADVQEIGDRLKSDQPVIVNLEGVDKELRRRIIDFSSGLTYALEGKLKEISTSVFLLSPQRVEVADEEMFRLRQRTVAKGVGLHGH